MSAGDIAGRFGHSWPTATRHLRLLTDAGLLIQERRGRARDALHNCRPLGLMRRASGDHPHVA